MSAPNDVAIARRVRAYFAPVNRSTGAPTVFDPARPFDLDFPPAPWIALGDVANFTRTATTKLSALVTGTKGAASGQFRGGLGARIACDFLHWGKLQMALAGGSQHMNVLAEDANASAVASGGAAVSPVAVLDGSTAQQVELGVGAVDAFDVGDMVAVDVDYMQQTGYVGTAIAAAYVKDAADVNRDRDYVRRVTFNVGRVAQKTTTALVLEAPLPGGVPASGASVQKVVAFVDREGGSFFQEWSALFVLEPESGVTVSFYYPRLQTAAPASEKELTFDEFTASALHAEFVALPVRDPNDGEMVACYRTVVSRQ